MRWLPDGQLLVNVKMQEEAAKSYFWGALPAKFLPLAQQYFDRHLAHRQWHMDKITLCKWHATHGHSYFVRWVGFTKAADSWVEDAEMVPEHVASAFWKVSKALKTRSIKRKGTTEYYCRHQREHPDHIGSCDYWYDMQDPMLTPEIKKAWQSEQRNIRKAKVEANGGACTCDIEELWYLTKRLHPVGFHSTGVAEVHQSLAQDCSAACMRRLWSVMYHDQVRFPKLPWFLPTQLMRLLVDKSGKFLGGSIAAFMKVSWVVASEETVSVDEEGKAIADAPLHVQPAELDIPTALHVEDIRAAMVLEEEDEQEEEEQAVAQEGGDAAAERPGVERVKKVLHGYQMEWAPTEAHQLFGMDPHRWRPVQVPNKSTKWYRLSSQNNILAEWFSDMLIFTNLHIECADSELTDEGMETPRLDPLICVPLKRKNMPALPVV